MFGEYSLNETYTIETEEEEHELPILKNKKVFKNPITISVYRNKFIKEEFIEKQFLYKDYIPAVYFDNK